MNRKSSTARLLAEKLTNIQGEIAKLKSDLTKLQEREKELLSAQRVIESLSDGGNAPQELALKPTPSKKKVSIPKAIMGALQERDGLQTADLVAALRLLGFHNETSIRTSISRVKGIKRIGSRYWLTKDESPADANGGALNSQPASRRAQH
jgi:hypothetical protein